MTAPPRPGTCPRCDAPRQGGVCSTCGLVFACPVCQVAYENPRGRICGNCETRIKQPRWSPGQPVPIAAAATTPEPTTAPVTRAEPLPAVVEATARYQGPGALRAAAAQYATALLAGSDAKAARPLLTTAIGEPGTRPHTTDLLLLRAHAAELEGDLGEAIRDLLAATTAAHRFLPGVARRLHSLLDRDDEPAPRRLILDTWAAAAANDGIPAGDIELLCVHAAVLEADGKRTADALRGCLESAAGDTPADALSQMLDDLRQMAEHDGRRSLMAAILLRLLGHAAEALAEVKRAIAAGFPDGDGSPGALAAVALEMQADLLVSLSRPAAAGRAYADAGYEYDRRDDYASAVPLLRKAVGYLSDDPVARWRLSDATRMLAWQSGSPDLALLREAVRTCEAGLDIAPRTDIPSWVYLLRAFLARDLADNDDKPGARNAHLLDGVTALEEAVALSGGADEWVYLASAHASLQQHATALATLEFAPAADDQAQSADSLNEAAWLALMAAAPDAAGRVDRYARHERANAGTKGLLLMQSRRPRAAIKPLERAVREISQPIICLWLLGNAHRLTRGAERARECFDEALRLRAEQPSTRDWQTVYAAADSRYRLGQFEQAQAELAELRPLLADWPTAVADVCKLSTLIHLAKGDISGARAEFSRALDEFRLPWDAYDLARDLMDLARRLESDGDAHLARTMADTARATARRLRDRLRGREAAVTELHDALRRGGDHHRAINACNASIARVCAALGRSQEAADAALAVLRRRPASPAGASRLVAAIDELIRDGKYEAARARLGAAMDVIPVKDRELAAELLARDGLAATLCGAATEAEQALSRALAVHQDEDAEAAVARIWISLLGGIEAYWQIRRTAGRQDGEVARVADLCLAAMLRLDDYDTETAWPFVTPIRVELADDLIPPDTSATGPMIGTYIPAMRERLTQAFTGPLGDGEAKWLPGVRLTQDSGLESGQFRVLLHEIPRAQSRVPAGMVFCLASRERVRAFVSDNGATQPALDPVTRCEAAWATADQAEAIDAAGIEVWRDPLLFVIRETEHQLRKHLDEYLSADEVERLLTIWKSQLGEDEAVPDAELERLTAVVRALVRDRVPVRDGPALLRATARTKTVADAVDAYRRAIADALPGNEDETIRLAVPPKLAALASARDGTEFPAERGVFEAMTELRGALADQPTRVALVAADGAARRTVGRYLAGEFPDVPVLSAIEATMRGMRAPLAGLEREAAEAAGER